MESTREHALELQRRWNPTPSMVSSETTQTPLTIETDNESSILHLLEAYGEGSENNQEELTVVILR